MDLEQQLREALRAADPGPRFTAAVEARLAAQRPLRPARARRWTLPASIAASLLVATVTALHVEQRRELQRVEQARTQLLVALDITSRRLEAVHRHLESQFAEDSP
jgi:hypothetical protein